MQRTGKTGRSGAGGSGAQTEPGLPVRAAGGLAASLGAGRIGKGGCFPEASFTLFSFFFLSQWGSLRGFSSTPKRRCDPSETSWPPKPKLTGAARGSPRGARHVGSVPGRVLPYLFICLTPPYAHSPGWIPACAAFTPTASPRSRHRAPLGAAPLGSG